MTRLSENGFEKAADLLGALANSKRMLILEIISKEETSVGSLAAKVDMSQSALSQHLSKLRGSKLVETRRDAQTIFYRCDAAEVRRILAILQEIFGVPDRLMSGLETVDSGKLLVTVTA